MMLELQQLKPKLTSMKSELEATKTKYEITKAEFEATKAELIRLQSEKEEKLPPERESVQLVKNLEEKQKEDLGNDNSPFF